MKPVLILHFTYQASFCVSFLLAYFVFVICWQISRLQSCIWNIPLLELEWETPSYSDLKSLKHWTGGEASWVAAWGPQLGDPPVKHLHRNDLSLQCIFLWLNGMKQSSSAADTFVTMNARRGICCFFRALTESVTFSRLLLLLFFWVWIAPNMCHRQEWTFSNVFRCRPSKQPSTSLINSKPHKELSTAMPDLLVCFCSTRGLWKASFVRSWVPWRGKPESWLAGNELLFFINWRQRGKKEGLITLKTSTLYS